MASWILVPCLVILRTEFDIFAPNRSKLSDGSVADAAHELRISGHNKDEEGKVPVYDKDKINEVHAIDVTAKLNLAKYDMQDCVNFIVYRHKNGLDNRLRNVIYNEQIWAASWDWTPRDYTGTNPHKEHAHFESEYTTKEEYSTRPWGLLELGKAEDSMIPSYGDSSQTVKYWQNVHNAVSKYFTTALNQIEVDGIYGPATAKAFASFYTAVSRKINYDGKYFTGWMAAKYQEIYAICSVEGI